MASATTGNSICASVSATGVAAAGAWAKETMATSRHGCTCLSALHSACSA